jgi:shingomyelin synthase
MYLSLNGDPKRKLSGGFDYPARLGEKAIDWISEDLDEYHAVQPKVDPICYKPPNPPAEKRKTFVALGFMIVGLVTNAFSLALVHDRVPDRDKYPPLPDAILDNIPHLPQLMNLPDIAVLVVVPVTALVILMNKYRWIVARRAFFILSVIYLMRSVTMYLTILPIANDTVFCSPKSNETTAAVVLERVSLLLGGGGMQISGQKSVCGDYIYSGHTAILTCACLFIQEYTPKRLYLFRWISILVTGAGITILLIARGHYSIDVLIGYYAATRMFWAYHSLANNKGFKIKSPTNFHANVWWFPIFQYLEGNVDAVPLPKDYSLPWRL